MPKVSYDYASGDLLENRNTYFYTKFQGRDFFTAWQRERATAIANTRGALPYKKNSSHAPIDLILEKIRIDLSSSSSHADALLSLNRILQRFEVTKRLHDEYNANWRPSVPQNYRGMERYVLFAEALDLAYAKTSKLPFLNTLLKCMDTVTALAAQLDSSQKNRVCQLIVRERDYVEQLLHNLDTQDWLAQAAK
jgi:methionyl-tRNA formyltransferase